MTETSPPVAIMWTTDRELRFTSVHGAALRALGRPIEQLVGLTVSEYFGQDGPDFAPVVAHRRALLGEPATYEMEIWGRWWDCHVEPVTDPSGAIIGCAGAALDATSRRRAEEALAEKEEQYRSIFEATIDGIVINDLAGYVVEASPAACAMHGYTREEFLGLHSHAFHPPAHRHTFDEYVETVAGGDEFATEDFQVQGPHLHLRKDGTTLPVEVHGTTFVYKGKPHILGVVRDISEQVHAYHLLEQRVAERTRELRALLDISQNVASTLELQSLLDVLLDQVQSVIEYSGAMILLADADDLALLTGRRPGGAADGPELSTRFPAQRLGAIWERNRAGESVIIPDVRGDDEAARAYQAAWGDYLETTLSCVRSTLSTPIMLKDRVIGLLSLSAMEPGYYTPHHAELALAIANQAAIAIENARLYAQAQELAALEERQKLARELHDSVSQALYGIALGSRTARTLLDRDPTQVAKPLDYVLTLAEAGLAEMRALIFELRPESLESEGLVAALGKQVAALRARHGLTVEFEATDEPEIPLDAKEALYRITQEALHNTVKHAQARTVWLQVRSTDAETCIEVRDDGLGFDPSARFPGHLGLHSMRERAERLHGTVTIESTPGQGACVRVRLPQ